MSEPRLELMQHGTSLFAETLARLSDDDLLLDSALAGWTRRHVLAHVHFNALALRRLVAWAATGVEIPMYESADARTREIEVGAMLPPAHLRALFSESSAQLEGDLRMLTPDQWITEIRTAQGRLLPAAAIPWLRAREVSVHSVDLAAGTTFGDVDPELVEALVVDAARKHAQGGFGARLAAWLTGRDDEAPTLGPWL